MSANLYVGENLPFDLLLGRPWQKGNRISIDERNDGTYLVFKHPTDPSSNMELLVDNTSAEETQMTWEKMTSLVFAACRIETQETRTDELPAAEWNPEISPATSNWWETIDLSRWEPDKITEENNDRSEAIITKEAA